MNLSLSLRFLFLGFFAAMPCFSDSAKISEVTHVLSKRADISDLGTQVHSSVGIGAVSAFTSVHVD